MIPSPYLTLYILALGATPIEVGLINSLGIVAGMMVEPLGGYLADRRGRVKLVSFATYFYAFSFIFYVVAQDWRFLAVGQILHRAFLFYTPGLNAILADSLPPSARGRGYALERTFPLALGVAAPYIGGLLIAHYGGEEEGLVLAMRQCYAATLLVGLLVATIRFRFLKETLSSDLPGLSIKNFPKILRESYGSVLDTIKWMPGFFHPVVLLQIIQSFSIAMAAPFWTVYTRDVFGLTTLDWGTLMLLSGIGSLVFILPVGYMVDRFGAKATIILSISLALVSVLLFLYPSSFWSAAIVLILLSVSNTMVTPSFGTLIANMISRDRRGRVYELIGEQGITVSTSLMPSGGLLLVVPASIGSSLGDTCISLTLDFPSSPSSLPFSHAFSSHIDS